MGHLPQRVFDIAAHGTCGAGLVSVVLAEGDHDHERICHEEEERIGTLAAKEEGVALVGGREGQDGADVVDDALGKEVMVASSPAVLAYPSPSPGWTSE